MLAFALVLASLFTRPPAGATLEPCSALEAQSAPPPKAADCKKCHGTGRLPCPQHPKAECELEDKVMFCSVVADCPVCGGTGFVLCDTCKQEAAMHALETKRELVKLRRPILQPIDDRMGRPLRKVESDHVVFMWDMEKHKIEKRWVDPHEAMHIYSERMEKMYADYCARLGVTDKEFQKKCWIFVWGRDDDHQDASVKFCE